VVVLYDYLKEKPMAATSLKLPDPLKRQLSRLAQQAGKTPHAFMVEALSREAQRAELRARFVTEAVESERETLASGKAHSLQAAFGYLEAKVTGRKVKLPKARAWRVSK
jgi:predicted transcriptional regulator